MPKRIQLRRTKGWRKPEGVIVVSRPTMWGNPFRAEAFMNAGYCYDLAEARQCCVDAYRDWVMLGELSEWFGGSPVLRDQNEWIRKHIWDLMGHDLACWCALDKPCHADVLLELANR